MFVVGGKDVARPIATMPGVAQLSVDRAVALAKEASEVGVHAVILFGIPETKDAKGSSGWDDQGPVPLAVRALKGALPDLLVITDVCMCEYTDHGHCGLLDGGEVDNDKTLDLLAKEAICHARAGADIVAPSDMMDGRVGRIRKALDGEGFSQTAILSYAVKYASTFYGPFREAAASAPRQGPTHRRSYQMDPGNVREALREVRHDIDEGADMVMVKPALPYLDIVAAVRGAVDVPVAAYNVSGEYAMIKAAAAAGMLDETAAMLEVLTSIRRAGADIIVTYHALEASRVLGGA